MNRRSDDEHTDEERDVQYLERLVRSLELSEGFSLYFAVCNQRPRVLKLMKRAEAEFPPDTVLRVAIEKPIISLRDYLLDAIEQTEKPPRALFVYGLESWIGKPEAPRAPLFLGMNTIRNFFAQTVNRSLVFWIPEYLYLGMLRAAPDFCSVRSGIYYFADSLPDQSRTELLTSGDQTGVMGLSLEEREQRIKDLTELLEEYRSVSEEMRDWTAEARLLRRLGELFTGDGHYEEAEPLLFEALKIRRKLLPEEHPDLADSLSCLGWLYRFQRRYQEAEPLFIEALHTRRKFLPTGHPDIANSLIDLGQLYRDEGQYQKAELFYLEALTMRRTSRMVDDPLIGNSLHNLAELYSLQRRYQEAEALYLEALNIRRKSLPRTHPYTATTLHSLARLYSFQGRYADAEPLYKQALETFRKSLPKNHPYITETLNNYLAFLREQGREAEASAFLKEWET